MRRGMNGALLALALMSVASMASAQFGGGTLVVSRVGDGSAALSSAATAAFMDDYSLAGTLGFSVMMATTNSGTATSELALSLSGNGQFLTLGGYNAAAGTASIASSTAVRTIERVSLNGTVDSSTGLGTLFSGNNIRSTYTSDGQNFWATGANGGLVYSGLGGAGAMSISTSPETNTRVVNAFGGNLYFTSASGTRGLYEVTGEPTSGLTTAVNIVNTGSSSSPYDFLFADANDLYIADDSVGIQKWTQSGGVWTLAYTGLGSGMSGIRSITSDGSGNIYGIALGGSGSAAFTSIVKINDTGAAFNITTLDTSLTSQTNEAFRGIEFIPAATPEPASLAALGLGIIGLVSRRRLRRNLR